MPNKIVASFRAVSSRKKRKCFTNKRKTKAARDGMAWFLQCLEGRLHKEGQFAVPSSIEEAIGKNYVSLVHHDGDSFGSTWLQEAIDLVTRGGVDARRKHMAKALIFQSIPEDVLLQVSKYQEPKDVWDAIRVRFLGAERVQKARLQTLRSELEGMRMLETETVDEFAGRLSGIQSKYRSLGSSLEEEVLVRKFLNSMPKKYLPIVASIEQYSEIENMAFEEVVGRLKAYEERVKPQEDLTRDIRDKLLLAHDDQLVKEKRGRCGGYNCCQQNRGKGKSVRAEVGRADIFTIFKLA
ncbi:hypothetical protein E3N88_04941 [Mikania micrantha]|uniref:Zinc finger, CCHC-type n=1 Tax=Mikania micrantha TaxID=192012 RepID=A0A5N6PWR5_9ASTR|nr:hypothetical protein E3N88_04941 [Mikania micrantha]